MGSIEPGRFRIGLRVEDVVGASRFYIGLGFEEVGSIPNETGQPVMVMLARDGILLMADALVGMPFRDSERERQTQAGPRGLGVAIGLGVDDLEASHSYCVGAGCTITQPPYDAPFGDRLFEMIDPCGYLWEISQPINDAGIADPFDATRDAWFPDA
jgi:uncharacterized glyoxalase superfamily protein PhnB